MIQGALQARLLPQTLVQNATMLDSDGNKQLDESFKKTLDDHALKIENRFERTGKTIDKERTILESFNLERR